MIHRHPHVFGDHGNIKTWDELKQEEKGRAKSGFLLDSVIRHGPALQVAYELQKKAATIGFDWTNVEDVWEKVKEELSEFQEVEASKNQIEMEKEFGDILFALVNIGRFYQIQPEIALSRTNEKFTFRFNHIEKQVLKAGKKLEQMSLQELDTFWEAAKRKE